MAKESAQALKVKKKKWFSIIAPPIFREAVVGEIFLYESGDMKGRCITANMMNLTNNPRNQSINIKFRIYDVKEGKGVTQVLGAEMNPGSIKRLMRRGRTKIEDSFVVQTMDKKLVRIKPVIIANSVEKQSVTAVIRKVLRSSVAKLAVKMTYDQLVEEIMGFKLQRHLGEQTSKVTRIKNSEIKAFFLVEREGVRPISPNQQFELPKKEDENFEDSEAKDANQGKEAFAESSESDSEVEESNSEEKPAEENSESQE